VAVANAVDHSRALTNNSQQQRYHLSAVISLRSLFTAGIYRTYLHLFPLSFGAIPLIPRSLEFAEILCGHFAIPPKVNEKNWKR